MRKRQSSPVATRTVDGIRWLVRGDMIDTLFGPDHPDWAHLADDARATLAKGGHDRSTWRVELSGRTVYAKVLEGHGPLDWLKCRLGLAAGQREWRNARLAESLGVPIARPLAAGARTDAKLQSLYVAEACGESTLPQAWSAVQSLGTLAERTTLIRAVARLMAATHQCGLIHRDGHPNNIVVQRAGSIEPVAALIDLPWVRFRPEPLELRQSAASLAQLDLYFQTLAGRTDRLRFIHEYYAARHEDESAKATTDRLRVILTEIADARASHLKRLAARRDRRLRRPSTYFARLRLGRAWTAVCALRPLRDHVFPAERATERTESDWRALLGGITKEVDAARDGRAGAERHEELVVEVRAPNGIVEQLAWSAWGSPPRRAFLDCHARRHRNERVPLVLAYAERRRAGLVNMAMAVRNRDDAQHGGAPQS